MTLEDPAGCFHRFPATEGAFECRRFPPVPFALVQPGFPLKPLFVSRFPTCTVRCGEARFPAAGR